MMIVRFIGNSENHEMSVSKYGSGLIQLHAPLPNVDLTAGFELLTKKGKLFGDYTEYTTIYRKMEDGSVILSNDGSVWTPPPEPGQVPEPEPPTLEEVQALKRQEVRQICEQTICAGVDVELPSGWAHFSLSQNDQLNLFGKQAQLAAGAKQLEYHEDGQSCRYFTAEEMQLVITAAMRWVSYHTTYCNSLYVWIAGAETIEEVNTIFYGADIPEEYQSQVLKDYLAETVAEAAEVVTDETVS